MGEAVVRVAVRTASEGARPLARQSWAAGPRSEVDLVGLVDESAGAAMYVPVVGQAREAAGAIGPDEVRGLLGWLLGVATGDAAAGHRRDDVGGVAL